MADDRIYDRTRELVPYETRNMTAVVCGAGMVGSWVVAALARILRRVYAIDPDKVEVQNAGVQLYTPVDEGDFKVDALMRYNGGFELTAFNNRMEDVLHEDGGIVPDVVVSAVDSMSGRKWLAELCQRRGVSLFIDVRVMGELVFVLTARPMSEIHHSIKGAYEDYLTTILPDDQVEVADCGSEGTVYSGLFAAARVAAIVNNYGRGAMIRPKEAWYVGDGTLMDEGTNGGEDAKGTDQGPQGHTADYTREQVEQEVRASEGRQVTHYVGDGCEGDHKDASAGD